jgi:hypothetical protein
MTLATAAVAYAERGWFVFPLQFKSKDPVPGTHGFKDATRDPAKVGRWWSAAPSANIGLWPGPSGLVVIDLDGAEGEATGQRCGLISEPTLMVISGRVDGGRHLYFSAQPGQYLEPTTLGPGTTVRHWKGYVVVPPSIHPTSGQQYRWAGRIGELRPLPPLTSPHTAPPARAEGPASPMGRLLPAGERNRTLASLAGSMRRRGMDPEEIAAALLVVNSRRCRPPLPEPEIYRIAASVGRYEPTPPAAPRQAGGWDSLS